MRFGTWMFLHLIGMALWLGGLFTLGMWTVRARKSGDANIVAFTYGVANRLYKGAISAGAVLTLVGGVMLMFETGRPWFRPFPEHWLFQMQVVGSVAFLVTILHLVPVSSRLASLAERARDEAAARDELSARARRQGITASLVGVALIYSVLLGGLRF